MTTAKKTTQLLQVGQREDTLRIHWSWRDRWSSAPLLAGGGIFCCLMTFLTLNIALIGLTVPEKTAVERFSVCLELLNGKEIKLITLNRTNVRMMISHAIALENAFELRRRRA